jgi:hypothetical protein
VSDLAALSEIADGESEPVRRSLEGLSAGGDSPFARVAGTHFARLVLVPALEGRDRAPLPGCAYIFLAAEFDGSPQEYAASLRDELGAELDGVFRHCRGYPGVAELDRFLLERRIPAGYDVIAYPGRTVEEVKDALVLSERLAAFALRAQNMAPESLQAEWRRAFAATA